MTAKNPPLNVNVSRSRLTDGERETLEWSADQLRHRGARLLIQRLGSNRDGDRHKMAVLLAYIEDHPRTGVTDQVRILHLTYDIGRSGAMSTARGNRHAVVFGGGGTSPVVGTLEIVGDLLGFEHPQHQISWSEI